MKLTSLDMPSSIEAMQAVVEDIPEGMAIEEVMQGLKVWKNPINMFTVLRLHRSADPRKRSQEWLTTEKAGMDTSTWMREMELVWEALDGRPVFGDEWSQEFHVSKSSLGWNPKLPVCRGWDFGLYPACLFAQLMPHQRLFILRECIGESIDMERFKEEVNRLSQEWFPGAMFYEFIDPTGNNKRGSDGQSYRIQLTKKPLRARNIILGANAIPDRHKAVIDFLRASIKGLPCYLVDPSCEVLIKGYNGGYFFAYNKGTLKTKPEKNIFSHVHDSNQYLCSKVLNVTLKTGYSTGHIVEPRFNSKAPSQSEKMAALA